MSQQELLKNLVGALTSNDIPYMLTGSLVSSLQGEPRATHDIDVIIIIDSAKVDNLISCFSPDQYYLNRNSVQNAIDQRGMFNIISSREGMKIDFWILTDSPFDQSRFSRRYMENLMGIEMAVSRPEDTILAKLSWAKLCGGSEKQFTDALRVFEVQYERLEMEYIEDWAKKLNIGDIWKRLKEEARICKG